MSRWSKWAMQTVRLHMAVNFAVRAMKAGNPYWMWRKRRALAWERGWHRLLGAPRVEGVA